MLSTIVIWTIGLIVLTIIIIVIMILMVLFEKKFSPKPLNFTQASSTSSSSPSPSLDPFLISSSSSSLSLSSSPSTSPTSPTSPTSTPETLVNSNWGWFNITLNTDSPKGSCQLYEFPGTKVGGMYFPGTPSFNPQMLNNLQGSPTSEGNPSCVDEDQILAAQFTITCTSPNVTKDDQGNLLPPNGPSNGDFRCVRMDGSIALPGETDIIYSDNYQIPAPPPGGGTVSVCPSNIQPCKGSIGVIAPYFQPQMPNIPVTCLSKVSPSSSSTSTTTTIGIGATGCNPVDPDQIFKVTLWYPGQYNVGYGTNGIYGQILDRSSGLCLVAADPSTMSTTVHFDPQNPNACCQDPKVQGCPVYQYSGPQLVLGDCSTAPSPLNQGFPPGYSWIFYPGSSSFGGGSIPPQIVWMGSIDIDLFPFGAPEELQGFWLASNGAKVIYYSGNPEDDGKVILAPFSMGNYSTEDDNKDGICPDFSFQSMFLDYTKFNTFSNITSG